MRIRWSLTFWFAYFGAANQLHGVVSYIMRIGCCPKMSNWSYENQVFFLCENRVALYIWESGVLLWESIGLLHFDLLIFGLPARCKVYCVRCRFLRVKENGKFGFPYGFSFLKTIKSFLTKDLWRHFHSNFSIYGQWNVLFRFAKSNSKRDDISIIWHFSFLSWTFHINYENQQQELKTRHTKWRLPWHLKITLNIFVL